MKLNMKTISKQTANQKLSFVTSSHNDEFKIGKDDKSKHHRSELSSNFRKEISSQSNSRFNAPDFESRTYDGANLKYQNHPKFEPYQTSTDECFSMNVAKPKSDVSRNLMECFRETFDKESRDKLSDVNHCQDYDTLNREEIHTESNNQKLSNIDGTEKTCPHLSPGGFYIDNDPINTSDCTSFPHYLVSPTPDKQENKLKNLIEENCDFEDRIYRLDHLAENKNALELNREKSNHRIAKIHSQDSSQSNLNKNLILNKQLSSWMHIKKDQGDEDKGFHKRLNHYGAAYKNSRNGNVQCKTKPNNGTSDMSSCYLSNKDFSLKLQNIKIVDNKSGYDAKIFQNTPQQHFETGKDSDRIEFNCFNEKEGSQNDTETTPKRELNNFKERILKDNTDIFNNSPTFREPMSNDNYLENHIFQGKGLQNNI